MEDPGGPVWRTLTVHEKQWFNSESERLAYLDSVLVQKCVQRDFGYGLFPI